MQTTTLQYVHISKKLLIIILFILLKKTKLTMLNKNTNLTVNIDCITEFLQI